MTEPEYAPQYTGRERLTHALRYGLPAVLFMILAEWVLFPWIQRFVAQLGCSTIFGKPDYVIFWYGLFVGVPLIFFTLIAAFLIPLANATRRTEQFPPLGQKTLRRTRIHRGRRAKLISYLLYIPPILFLAFAIWGAIQAHNSIADLERKYPNGVPCQPINDTPTSS